MTIHALFASSTQTQISISTEQQIKNFNDSNKFLEEPITKQGCHKASII